VAVGIVLLANVMRTTALFFVEAKVMVVDETWHSGIGMTVFVFAALGVAAAAHRFRTIAHVA
jgi:exosortase/archaeosortase family protein